MWGANPQDWGDRDKRPSLEVDLARREHARWLEIGLPLQSYGLELLKPFYPVELHMIEDIVVLGGDALGFLLVNSAAPAAKFEAPPEGRGRGLSERSRCPCRAMARRVVGRARRRNSRRS